MENSLNNIPFLLMLFRWKKHIMIVLVSVFVVSIIFSFLIKNQYKSEAIVYPINITPFSGESNTEQLIQLFESAEIRDNIIRKFNLSKHYNIDITSNAYYSKLISTLESNVTITKTNYESIDIVVYDTDPKVACDMVNAYIEFLNLKIITQYRKRVLEYLTINKNLYERKKAEKDSLENLIDLMRSKYEIVDIGSQVKEATRAKLSSINQKGKSNPKIDTLLRNIESKGGVYEELNSRLWKARGEFSDFKFNYETSLNDYKKELSFTTNVSSPKVADKKTYPVRWLIVFGAVISSLIITIAVIFLIENYKKLLSPFFEEKK